MDRAENGDKIVPLVATDNTAGVDVTADPEDTSVNVVGPGAMVVNGLLGVSLGLTLETGRSNRNWNGLNKKVADSIGGTLLLPVISAEGSGCWRWANLLVL